MGFKTMRPEHHQEFLEENPFMSLRPSPIGFTVLEGELGFRIAAQGLPEIEDGFKIRLEVPSAFPDDLPTVTETDGRIPRLGQFHVNGDGSLCLGSSLSLMIRLQDKPTLSGFMAACVIPYLYAMSLTLKHGHRFPFGELDHGRPGLINDYLQIFGLTEESQLMLALDCLALKKRVANKKLCPCTCGKRLGNCQYNTRIQNFRRIFPRSWFRKHLSALKAEG